MPIGRAPSVAQAASASEPAPALPAGTRASPLRATAAMSQSTGVSSGSRTGTMADEAGHRVYLPVLLRADPPPEPVVVTAAPNHVVSDGVSASAITVKVRSTDTVTIASNSVILRTTQGLFPNGNTNLISMLNENGEAYTTLKPSLVNEVGEATVTAQVFTEGGSEVLGSTTVWFEPLEVDPAWVIVTTVPSYLPSDGASTTIVTATVRDVDGIPVAGSQVTFRTTVGTFSNGDVSVIQKTDTNGKAETSLNAPAWEGQPMQAIVTAQANAQDGTEIIGTRKVWFESPEPAPLRVEVTTVQDEVPVDGHLRTMVRAVVREVSPTLEADMGVLVPNYPVTFSTTEGTFSHGSTSIEATTNMSGEASVALNLVWSKEVVEATVTAQVIAEPTPGAERAVVGETKVWFAPPETNLLRVSVTANPGRISANGSSESTILAVVQQVDGTPIEHYPVTFHTTLGTFDNEDTTITRITNAAGEAQTTLRSPFGEETLQATVIAQVSTATGEDVVGETNVWFAVPSRVFVTAVPRKIPAQVTAVSEIIATVLDDTGTLLVGYPVDFSTTLGNFANDLPFVRVSSDAEGVARATLHAAPALDTAVATAQIGKGDVADSVTVEFVVGLCRDTEPNSVPIEAKEQESAICTGSLEEVPDNEGTVDDYYWFYLSYGQRVNIDLTHIPAGADYDLVLHDAAYEVVAYSNEYDNLDEYVEYASPYALTEKFYLRVNAAKTTDTAEDTYRLKLVFTEPATGAQVQGQGERPGPAVGPGDADPALPPKPPASVGTSTFPTRGE
ncbi:MAG: hypothetical protein HC884_10435 [Chloroflexaceae bacterium]|nr:hypothetical protein [Chloroflexaceae bacterium]